MSMNTWIVYGNGFNINEVKPLTMINFIKKHKKTFCQSEIENKIFKDLEDTDNGFSLITIWMTSLLIMAILANIQGMRGLEQLFQT